MLMTMPDPATWSIEYRLREDEERLFVAADRLPGAQPGDVVEIHSTQPPRMRRGRVVEHVHDHVRGEFVTVLVDAETQAETAMCTEPPCRDESS